MKRKDVISTCRRLAAHDEPSIPMMQDQLRLVADLLERDAFRPRDKQRLRWAIDEVEDMLHAHCSDAAAHAPAEAAPAAHPSAEYIEALEALAEHCGRYNWKTLEQQRLLDAIDRARAAEAAPEQAKTRQLEEETLCEERDSLRTENATLREGLAKALAVYRAAKIANPIYSLATAEQRAARRAVHAAQADLRAWTKAHPDLVSAEGREL